MTVSQALETRRAVPSFAPEEIHLDELFALLNKANLAPSSRNLQPWEYLVVVSPEDKARLQAASYNQKKISEASAAVVVLGNLNHHLDNAARVADDNIAKGYLKPEGRDGFIASAAAGWPTPQTQRDEAFRAGSLWGMSLMLAAKEAGWDSGPMSGFEADKVSAEFGLPEHILPVLIVTIGKANPAIHLLPRGERFPAEELASIGNYGVRKG